MLGSLIEKRIKSLIEYNVEIERVLQEMNLEAIDKNNQELRSEFMNFSRAVQDCLVKYIESLEIFIKDNLDFSYKDYELLYAEIDEEILTLITEYSKQRIKLETCE